MPPRDPLGVYTRSTPDWFHKKLAVATATIIGNSLSGQTVQLWNNSTVGERLYVYGITSFASGGDAEAAYVRGYQYGTPPPVLSDINATGGIVQIEADQPAVAGQVLVSDAVESEVPIPVNAQWQALGNDFVFFPPTYIAIIPPGYGMIVQDISTDVVWNLAIYYACLLGA